jgi:hypothetical protein
MKALTRRIGRLEHQLSTDGSSPGILLVLSGVGCQLALDQDKCIQILCECELLSAGGVCVVDFSKVPHGLNAEETKKFLREKGAEICGLRSAQNYGGRAGGALQENQRR